MPAAALVAHVRVPREGGGLQAGGQIEAQGGLGKPEHGLQRHVALHVLGEDLDVFADLLGVGEHLFDDQGEHLLLGLGAPDVGVLAARAVVAVTEAAHLHGLLAVQVGHARLVEDGQLLGGVVVAHVDGDVEVHAPHLVHQGDKALDAGRHVVVDGDAQHVGDHVPQVLRPLVVGGVDLAVALDQGVPGDGDQARLLVHRVVHGHHDGVGVAAGGVAARQEHGVGVGLALQRRDGVGQILPLFGVRVVGGADRLGGGHGGSLGGRLGGQLIGAEERHDDGGEDHQGAVQGPARPAGGRRAAGGGLDAFSCHGARPLSFVLC